MDKVSCEQILFQIQGSGIFSGIERGGFTAALLGGEHYNLFSNGEVQQFTNAADNNDLLKPIQSACQRLGGRVLWAVYDTLLSTRDAPGAVQHGNIASKLHECVDQSLGECVMYIYSICAIWTITIVRFIYSHYVLFSLFNIPISFRSVQKLSLAVTINFCRD